MNQRNRIESRLSGDAIDIDRRQKLLATFLPAFDGGGVDEAATALTQQLDALEATFAQHLKALHQLL